MRRARFHFIPVIIFMFVQVGTAQSLDQILLSHFEATGQEQLSRVSNVRSSGIALQMGVEHPFLQIQKRPDKMYLEIVIQEMKLIQAFDGRKGWAVEPWVDSRPRELTGNELHHFGRMARIDSDLVSWRDRGYLLEYIGQVAGEGQEFFILKLTKEEGETYHFHLDADSYLIMKMVTWSDHDGDIVEGETILGDYREIGGIKVPFRTEVRFGGQTLMTNIMEKVEFDVAIGSDIFSIP
jgi:hypothetical protein